MPKFFVNLDNNGLIKSWVPLFDWLFDDEKFDDWSAAMLGKYIKRLKKELCLGEKNYSYGSMIKLRFPNRLTKHNVIVLSGRYSSEAKDWVRHIRNSIAHGKARIINEPNEPWIEIKDYSRSKEPSAYMYFPVSFVNTSFSLYKEINKQKKA